MNDATIQAPTTGAAIGCLGIGVPKLPSDCCDNCLRFGSLVPVDHYESGDLPGVTLGRRAHVCISCATSIVVDKLGELARNEAERGEERVL